MGRVPRGVRGRICQRYGRRRESRVCVGFGDGRGGATMGSVNGSGSTGALTPAEPLTAPRDANTSGDRPMGTILTDPAPLVSDTRREAEIRHHERQLCATELLMV